MAKDNTGKVKLVSTDKDKNHKTGAIFYAPPDMAQAIIEKGFATQYLESEGENGHQENGHQEKGSEETAPKSKGKKK